MGLDERASLQYLQETVDLCARNTPMSSTSKSLLRLCVDALRLIGGYWFRHGEKGLALAQYRAAAFVAKSTPLLLEDDELASILLMCCLLEPSEQYQKDLFIEAKALGGNSRGLQMVSDRIYN